MLIYSGEVWISLEDFTLVNVSSKTVYDGINRNSPKWQYIKDPDDRRKRLIRFETLAAKYKDLIKSNLCGGLLPQQWLKLKREEDLFAKNLIGKETLEEALERACTTDYFAKGFLYPGVSDLQLKCLCRSAAVIEETVKFYRRNGLKFKDHGPVKILDKWLKANKDDYFPVKYLPAHYLNLMEKVRAYAVDELPLNEVVYQPRLGNDNRIKGKPGRWWQELAIYYRVDDRNYTESQIFRKIRLIASRNDKQAPSESTIRQFLQSKEHLTVFSHSDLNNKRLQRHRPSMPLARAMFSDDCWEMDGTQVQLLGHGANSKNQEGKKAVKTLSIVAVRDVYSGAYLGYWYGYNESEQAYRSALKMAVEITGRVPYELRFDQFPGSTSGGWKALAGTKTEVGLLQRYGIKVTKTSKSTGKANAERGFYTLQQVFEAERAEYLGHGIKSSLSHARPTEKYIARTQKAILENGWDFEKAMLSHFEVIAQYNNTPLSEYSRAYKDIKQSPWQMYQDGIDNSGREVSPIEISELFWNARNEGIRNGKIEFMDRGKKYTYCITEEEFDLLKYQRKGVKLLVRHDPNDFSKIMVFDDNKFLAELHEQNKIQMHGRNADWASASKWKEEQKAIEKKRKAKLNEYALSAETALLLPTTTEKQVYNDAQTAYAHRNATDWLPNNKPVQATSRKATHDSVGEDFDIDDHIFRSGRT